ncbi:hypothetical protein MOQ_010312 [Trypanosoma cruzi marinkellei]|uniref:Uncharacterized protein n=1 Tax=Trypanosoma cruzi marinkellei TaxID=85056 RepID=K2MFX1_TRYCR|nr:hypothetical protein MOQ_010312 [Trypanosoma cruzi marinkellei]
MAAIHAVRPQPQQSRTVAAHTRQQKRKQNKRKKRRQGVAVCVWRCECLPALAAIKQNKRERNVCSTPQALVARPHVTAPSARGARETKGRVCGCVPRAQRLSSPEEAIVAPSVTRQHTPSNARTRQSKNKWEKNDPKSRQHLHAWRASCSRVSRHPAKLKKNSCGALCKYLCVCVCWRSRREEEHREAHQHSKRHSWMAAIHAVRPQPQQSRTVAAHTRQQKENKTKEKSGGRVWLCVCGAASVCPPWQQ